MPYSDASNIAWVKWFLDLAQPTTIIDVGPGAGKYGALIKEVLPEATTTAVEIWGPYVGEFGLESVYDQVHICDARIYPDYDADLVILGDVLEHMSRADALALWGRIAASAKAALISIPVVHYPQGCEHGNPFETHVEDHWSHDEVLASFAGITGYREFGITATYVAEFARHNTDETLKI